MVSLDFRILLEEDHYNWITDTEIAEAKEYIQVHRSRPDMDHHQNASSQVTRHTLRYGIYSNNEEVFET